MNEERRCQTCKYGDLPLNTPICKECLAPEFQNWFPEAAKTNADLLRAESDEGLADAIFYTLSEFQSKEALLAYLREEVNTDA